MTQAPTRRDPQLQFSLLYQELGFDQLGKPIFVGPYNDIQVTGTPINALLWVSNGWTNGFGLHTQRTAVVGPDDEELVVSDEVDFFLKDALAAHRVDQRLGLT